MPSVIPRIAMRPRFWGLVCASWLVSVVPASAQIGYGGYGGYGMGGGYGGFGGGGYGGYGGGGFAGVGYGGYGVVGYGGLGGLGYGGGGGIGYGGYGGLGYGGGGIGYGGYGGYGGFGGVSGYGVGGFGGSFGGYPLRSSINAYNLGYGNTLGIGLVPPAYVGTGTAGLGPIGIGGTNPLFGLGLSPLAIHNAVAEQALRQRIPQNSNYYRGYNGNGVRMKLYDTTTLPNSFTNTTIPNAVSTAPR